MLQDDFNPLSRSILFELPGNLLPLVGPVAVFRDLLLSVPTELRNNGRLTMPPKLAAFVPQLLAFGRQAALDGQLFVLEHSIDQINALLPPNAPLKEYPKITVPYPVTPIIWRAPNNPFPVVLVVLSNGFTGELQTIGGWVPGLDPSGHPSLTIRTLLNFVWSEDEQRYGIAMPTNTDPEDLRSIGGIASLAVGITMQLADDRHELIRNTTPVKLNAARVKRGVLPIPDYWRVAYRTAPTHAGHASGKGGTHTSPRPHGRRGHERHLASGKTVWVRDCRINETLRHLTRDREYYRLRS